MSKKSYYNFGVPFCNSITLRIFLYAVSSLYPVVCFIYKTYDSFHIARIMTIFYLLLLCFIATEDMISMTIPNFLNLSLFLCCATMTFMKSGVIKTIKLLSAALIVFLILWIITSLTKVQIGGGDIKMMAALTAYHGIKQAFCISSTAFFIAAIFCIILLLFSNKKRTDGKIPFGPFITLSVLLQSSILFP